LSDDFHVDADLVEAVCLSHDLGHPPFGHAGERILHALMREHGGFEGNAQTLRLLTEIIYLNENSGTRGMAPTRAFLDGVLKYKTLLSETPTAENHFIYDDQLCYRGFVFDSPDLPEGAAPGDELNAFRSLECQIMDWADDTAYSLNDIIDGVRAGFLAFEKMDKWAERSTIDEEASAWMTELKRAITRDTLEAVFSKKIGECIRACRLVPWENAMSGKTNRYAFKLEIDEGVRRQVTFYKNMANDLIFASPQLAQMEHNGRHMLRGLFEAMHENYIDRGNGSTALVTRAIDNLINGESTEEGKTRRICDYLAGLTDSAARRTWKRLFDPNSASIKELG
jgi:dGTPase